MVACQSSWADIISSSKVSRQREENYDESGNLTGEVFKNEWYNAEIPKSDYKKDGISSILMKITYDNGLVDLMDVTHQIESSYIY